MAHQFLLNNICKTLFAEQPDQKSSWRQLFPYVKNNESESLVHHNVLCIMCFKSKNRLENKQTIFCDKNDELINDMSTMIVKKMTLA